MKTIAFFNNKGGVGKTTLVYHVAWMFRELGVNVVAVDLDPQSNLTAAFLSDDRMVELLNYSDEDNDDALTILGAINPLVERLGDVNEPHLEDVEGIGLVAGDLGLNIFEDRLAAAWPACLDDNQANAADAFRVMTSFYRVMHAAAKAREADVVLIDVGPNLGAINRAALVAADYVVMPLGANLFSLRGLQNIGPTLREWRAGWENRRKQGKAPRKLLVPDGGMQPIGYVILQHAARQHRPVKPYQNWIDQIPNVYRKYVLSVPNAQPMIASDPNMLATLRHYRSLMPLAENARKPVFALRAADGAIGSNARAVQDAFGDFERLTRAIAKKCAIAIP